MAPFPITALDLPAYLRSLSLPEREALSHPPSSNPVNILKRFDVLSPLQAHNVLLARSPAPTRTSNPAAGSVPPEAFNNKGIQALFALIGASFVLGSIWFFFWAKNGGFQFRKGDWDDYKSTVLRRKGPNGTTLSNATKSTRLGGGSVVGQGYSDADGTATEFSGDSSIMSEKKRAKNQKAYLKNLKKENAREAKIKESKEAGWEGGHDDDVRAYRHEKVARVGGLNKDSEAMHVGTDYSPSATSAPREPRQNRQTRNSRHTSPEKEYVRYGEDAEGTSRPSRYHSPSKEGRRSYQPEYDAQSVNTKAYHHPMPGLKGQGQKKGGFRRGMGDDLDD